MHWHFASGHKSVENMMRMKTIDVDACTLAVSEAMTKLNNELKRSKAKNWELLKMIAAYNRTKQIRNISSREVDLYHIAGHSTVFTPVYRELEFGCAIVGFGGNHARYGGLQLVLGSNPPSQMDEQEHRYWMPCISVSSYAVAKLLIAGVPHNISIENAEEYGFESV